MTTNEKVPVRSGGPIRRVTDLQVQGGSEGRIAVEIATTGRVGVLEGVHVDFTHADLPAAEWWARPWWHVWADGEQHCGLIFPGEARVAAAGGERWERIKSQMQREQIHARVGDKVTVARVRHEREVTFLHHEHDYSVRHAYLTLTRPDGSTINDIGPLAFYGNTRLIGHGSREAFDNAIARISTLAPGGLRKEWSDLDRIEPWKHGPLDAALHYAGEAHDEMFELLDELSDDDTMGRLRLRELANAAILAGFALAKYEAQRADKWDAARRAASQKGGDVSRRDDWRDAAKEIWRQFPNYTKTKVANILVERFNPSEPKAIEVRSMIRAIEKFAPPTSKSHNPETYEPWT